LGTFGKRIYDVRGFREAILDVFDHIDDLRAASRDGRVGRAFAERIMLAVTQVNGCRYCSFGHARMALRAGVHESEVRRLAEGDFTHVPQDQLTAVIFAQHWAETGGKPDPAAWHRVVDEYGSARALDVVAYIRMIMVGNLLGNTFDAFLSRIRGSPARGSSIWQEIGVLLSGLVFVPEALLRRWLVRGRAPSQEAYQ